MVVAGAVVADDDAAVVEGADVVDGAEVVDVSGTVNEVAGLGTVVVVEVAVVGGCDKVLDTWVVGDNVDVVGTTVLEVKGTT